MSPDSITALFLGTIGLATAIVTGLRTRRDDDAAALRKRIADLEQELADEKADRLVDRRAAAARVTELIGEARSADDRASAAEARELAARSDAFKLRRALADGGLTDPTTPPDPKAPTDRRTP